jgi:Zn-dependent peptidase ImmA (M78 family)
LNYDAGNMRVEVRPAMLRWALERAGLTPQALSRRLPKLEEWERGEGFPTLKQVESFAKATHTPVGFLFLPEPPVERVPIPDFRTVKDAKVERPSPDLLDTIYTCQQRQEWYRDFARSEGHNPLPFVGSVTITTNVEETARRMRGVLGFEIEERRRMPTWTDALRRFIDQADIAGVLVMVSGVVGSNNRRKLNPTEFRGFALVDDLAPLVFVNGADSKSAQMFTVAHELAHVWLGQSALSDSTAASLPGDQIERWCNQVAAEFLVPLDALRAQLANRGEVTDEVARLARVFKVSTLVILRRLADAGVMTNDAMWRSYNDEVERLSALPAGSGGDFYLTQAARVSKRFARALVTSTLEGHTLHRDAFRLLGFSKLETFKELGRNLGVA